MTSLVEAGDDFEAIETMSCHESGPTSEIATISRPSRVLHCPLEPYPKRTARCSTVNYTFTLITEIKK